MSTGSKNVEKFGNETGQSVGAQRFWYEEVWQKAFEHIIEGQSLDPLRSVMMLWHVCPSWGANDELIAMWRPHFAKGSPPLGEREAALGRHFALVSTPVAPSDEDVRQAEEHRTRAENRLRLLTDLARLRAECLTSAQVREGLGVSRERLRQLRNEGRLIAIPVGDRRSMLYPYWQFAEDGLIDGIETISDAAEESGLSPRQLHFFMTEKNDRLDGRDPARVLLRGDNQGEAREAAERIARVLRTSGLGEL